MDEKIEIRSFANRLLIQDCIDLLNVIFSISEKDRPVFMLASAPYICLVTNEAYEWCKRAGIHLEPFQSKTILENIRAKSKLFSNDTVISFTEQRSIFNSIIKAEHSYYKKLAKPYCPHFLIDDVGTYVMNRVYIGNTIQYAYDFRLFSKLDSSIYESGNEIKSFSSEIGSKLQEIITKYTGKPYVIPEPSITTQLHIDRDFNFKRKFVSVDNILVFSLVCRINFLLYFFKANCSQNSMLYLRLIYITFFSLKNELENLKIGCDDVFNSYYDQTFRNCMAHYSLFHKIKENKIKPFTIGYGLIEEYFDVEYSELVEIIESRLNLILSSLEKRFKCK